MQVAPPAPSLGNTALTTARHFLPQSVVEEAADLSSHLLARLRLPAAAAPEKYAQKIAPLNDYIGESSHSTVKHILNRMLEVGQHSGQDGSSALCSYFVALRCGS